MTFVLDQRLAESSFFVDDWALCRACLKNDKTYPWLYLVPRKNGIREFFELTLEDRSLLIEEIARAGKLLQGVYNAKKINTAALGNMVPQLHIHVCARFENDTAWPRPTWAVAHTEIPYTQNEKDAEIQKLKSYTAR